LTTGSIRDSIRRKNQPIGGDTVDKSVKELADNLEVDYDEVDTIISKHYRLLMFNCLIVMLAIPVVFVGVGVALNLVK